MLDPKYQARPGQSPRDAPNHRERGPARYRYTAAEVAELAGVSVVTVRRYLGPEVASLAKVVDFVAARRQVAEPAPAPPDDLEELLRLTLQMIQRRKETPP